MLILAACLLFVAKLHFSLIYRPLHHFEELLTTLDGVARVLLMVLTVAFLLALSLSLSIFQSARFNQSIIYQIHGHANIPNVPFYLRLLATFHCIHLWSPVIW